MLSNKTIEAVKESIRIKDIVERYISLKKSGMRYVSTCPFHNERTPSFFISEKGNFFKCFGCGESGDAIKFVQKIENVGFIDAIEIIANIYKIPVLFNSDAITDEEVVYNEKKSAEILLDKVTTFFSDNLYKCDELKKYLLGRNISDDIIKEFRLGYSNGCIYNFLKENKFDINIAIKYGVLKSNLTEVFLGRLIIPLYNQREKIVGFGARVFNVENASAKYINSSDSLLFHKSDFLFNLNNAKKYIKDNESIYIVEGYFDVLSLYSVGIKNVVASCGTALTDSHCKLLSRYTNNIVLFYDSDNAGIKATLSAITKILKNNLKVKVAVNRKFKDPDELIRNSKELDVKAFLNENELDLVDFYLYYFNYGSEKDINKKSDILKNIFLYLENINDYIYKNLLLNKLKEITNINFKIEKAKKVDDEKKRCDSVSLINEYENEIIITLLKYSESKFKSYGIIELMLDSLKEYKFADDINREIFLIYSEFIRKNTEFDLNVFLQYINDDVIKDRVITYISINDIEMSDMMRARIDLIFNENVDKIKNKIKYLFLKIRLYYIKAIIKEKVDRMKYLVDKNDILNEISELKKDSNIIAKLLKVVII